jgi:hypothetical protein
LKRKFGKDMRDRYRREYVELIGKTVKSVPRAKRTSYNGKTPVMAKYLNGTGIRLRRKYKGQKYKARIREDGKVLFNRVIYSSPTMVGQALCNHAVNGREFWEYEREPGDWVKLEKLRR